MNRLLYILAIMPLLAVAPYKVPPPSMARCPEPTLYKLAEAVTGAPAEILQGIARAESGECDSAIGDNGESLGRFQLREIYHESRAKAWGNYDPRNPTQAAVIAGHILMDNFKQLGNMDLAIMAYRQGIGGVLRDGGTIWYLQRVKG